MDASTRTVELAEFGMEFEILSSDSIIGPAIAQGSWADSETRLFRAHLVPGCTVVDLGANIGWFAVQAILAGATVHAFEPVPAIADVCERNLRRAEAVSSSGGARGGRGILHRSAAGAEKGTAEIAVAAENFGDNRVLDSGSERPQDMGSGELITIDIVRVDDCVKGPVRFMKIDTQGSEFLALTGAEGTFDASGDMGLLIEFWPYALRGAEPEQVLEFLYSRGFTLGKATEAPYPMTQARILAQVGGRDEVRGGIDLYGTRGLPFHVLGAGARLRGWLRGQKET